MQLFHRDLGGAGRPPLVILHGMLGSSRNWLSVGTELAGTFHVSALDLRNHGRSPHDIAMNYGVLADDVLAWLDSQRLARAALLGHSLGGKVAMRLACRAPERVARLVVVDIAPRAYPDKLERAEFAAMRALRLDAIASRGDAERAMESLVPAPLMRKFLTTNLEQEPGGAWRWTINLPTLTAAVPVLVENPLVSGDRYDGLAQFITGGQSDFVRPEDATAIRGHFPAAKIVTIAGCGHNPHMEARVEFVRLVTEAVAS